MNIKPVIFKNLKRKKKVKPDNKNLVINSRILNKSRNFVKKNYNRRYIFIKFKKS